MILKFTLIVSLLTLYINLFGSKDEVLMHYEKSNLVALVSISDVPSSNKNHILLNIEESYKGYMKVVSIPKNYFNNFDNNEFVIFAKYKAHNFTELYYVIELNDTSNQIRNFLINLPCIDDAEIESRNCFKMYDPVCGCDGVTYGNTCAMYNAGILKFYSGECEK